MPKPEEGHWIVRLLEFLYLGYKVQPVMYGTQRLIGKHRSAQHTATRFLQIL